MLVRRRLDGVGVADGPVAVRRRVPRAVVLVPLVPVRGVGPPAFPPDQPRADGYRYHDHGDHDADGDGDGLRRVGGGFGVRRLC